MSFAVESIRSIAALDRIAFKKHSILRMRQRNITVDDVKWVLLQSDRLIEEYPADRPLPSCLILGYDKDGRALHVVVAVDKDEPMLWVITVYEPNLNDWEEGFEKRRE